MHEIQSYYFSSKYFTWGIFIADSHAFATVVKEWQKKWSRCFLFFQNISERQLIKLDRDYFLLFVLVVKQLSQHKPGGMVLC